MSQEIIEGIRTIEREKGIEEGTLVSALEDALLAAYKKLPGSARHAEVILDEDGEFKVFAIEIPGDLEERLLDEAMEAKIDELERLEDRDGRAPAHADQHGRARSRLGAGSRRRSEPHRRHARTTSAASPA